MKKTFTMSVATLAFFTQMGVGFYGRPARY